MMKLLVIGGTKFLGRYVVESALARGHEVTMLNRGLYNPSIFPEVETLHGDRNGDLDVLRGRHWNAVVDTCGFFPSSVRRTARLLSDAVEHYTFISSISVYKEFSAPGLDESNPLSTINDEQLREAEALQTGKDKYPAKALGEFYGPLKALCEQAAEAEMPGRVMNVRAGLIVGPHDYSDRFTYWMRRIARGGEILVPDIPERQVQMIDVRDLADWLVHTSESRQAGTFNATGPDYLLTMRSMLEVCREVSGSDAQFTWVGEQFLLDAGVGPWGEMPLWIPYLTEEDQATRHFQSVSCAHAVASGLKFRPISETIQDTLTWDNTRPKDEPLIAGITPEREADLLRDWHKRTQAAS
ncbi:MAG: SDR family oxidoreductase [Acidobacteria bacterium]|nr:SDR family oxidoreductase [Acidobacteriota bacterium]